RSGCPRHSRGPLRPLGTTVGGGPSPDLAALAARGHALAVDIGEDIAFPAEQRLGGAHLGAHRQLAFGETIAAVLLVLGFGVVGFRAAGAERALVHLAAHAERPGLRKLRRAERTC